MCVWKQWLLLCITHIICLWSPVISMPTCFNPWLTFLSQCAVSRNLSSLLICVGFLPACLVTLILSVCWKQTTQAKSTWNRLQRQRVQEHSRASFSHNQVLGNVNLLVVNLFENAVCISTSQLLFLFLLAHLFSLSVTLVKQGKALQMHVLVVNQSCLTLRTV